MNGRELAETLWPGLVASTDELGSDVTRYNTRVTLSDGRSFVLRRGSRDTRALGISRERELEATLTATAIGVGPEVVEFLAAEGVLVTRWIEGHVVTADRIHDPETLRRLGAVLRAVHGAPSIPGRFDVFRVVEDYRSQLFAADIDVPVDYAWARQIARRVEAARGPAPERVCHNDLVAENVIDDGTRLRLVDWEYAGMGDPLFDLACVAVHNDLDADLRRELLTAYAGSLRHHEARALELLRFMVGFREAMWALAQAPQANEGPALAAHAAAQFAWLHTLVDDPAFRDALG